MWYIHAVDYYSAIKEMYTHNIDEYQNHYAEGKCQTLIHSIKTQCMIPVI